MFAALSGIQFLDLHDPQAMQCACGPLATRRRRMAVACACIGVILGSRADPRLTRLLEVGQRYSRRTAQIADIEVALQEADAAVEEARASIAAPVWSLFEGLRTGKAAVSAREARTATAGIRWALRMPGGICPPVPPAWDSVRAAVALAATAPSFDPAWRTGDVLALARQVRDAGTTDILPILADALQDAGCDDEQILRHCRGSGPHTAACWVPDLVLDEG